MDEFELIDAIVGRLGARTAGRWVQLGPGDDAAVIEVSPGTVAVASIDTLLADVHFPQDAPAACIGYRALAVALSDLAAMAATPRYVLVSLSLERHRLEWAVGLAKGMADAAERFDVYLCGGNVTEGPLNITVSVHGEALPQHILRRDGARAGDIVYVSGPLGAAAAVVRQRAFHIDGNLAPEQTRYYKPNPRFDCAEQLHRCANSGIDISDGLVADLHHIAAASRVAIDVTASLVPIGPGATLEDALYGGDDYELAITASAQTLAGFTRIGIVQTGAGVTLDGEPVAARGYRHFKDA